MNSHRFAEHLRPQANAAGAVSLMAPGSGGAGFVLCPLAWQVSPQLAFAWQQVYQVAYERAQAVLRPGPTERLYRMSNN